MVIILDLDDTVFVNGELCKEMDAFRSYVKEGGHGVLLWTSHPDGLAIAQLFGFSFLSKDAPGKPNGDVLIDDQPNMFAKMCNVNETFGSIREFLYGRER